MPSSVQAKHWQDYHSRSEDTKVIIDACIICSPSASLPSVDLGFLPYSLIDRQKARAFAFLGFGLYLTFECKVTVWVLRKHFADQVFSLLDLPFGLEIHDLQQQCLVGARA